MSDKKIEYFSVWRLQNKITLISLIGILLLSAVFVVESVLLPSINTTHVIAFIVIVPALACFGIAASHSSNLEAAKAQREYEKLRQRLAETENSQFTLDRFFSISSDLMAIAGNDGLLKKVSTSLVNTLGYSESVLLSTPFFEFIHPEDREPTKKNIQPLTAGLRSVGFENRYRTIDGSYRTLSWSAAADAELGLRFASARDVTNERNFQFRIQQILDSGPFLLVVKNLDGTITNCNSAFADHLGQPRESVLGKKEKRFYSEEAFRASQKKDQEVLQSKAPMTFEEAILKKDSLEKYLSTIFPILDQTGTIVGLGKISVSSEVAGKNKPTL